MQIELDSAKDNSCCRKEEWLPETWVKRGFIRDWRDASVMSEYFEILRKEDERGIKYIILCPTFLRRPLEIFYHYQSWGNY